MGKANQPWARCGGGLYDFFKRSRYHTREYTKRHHFQYRNSQYDNGKWRNENAHARQTGSKGWQTL